MTGTELPDLIKFAALFVTPAVGAYFGSYLKKKGENLASHEDIRKLVEQVSAVTAATKQIEARITRASRVHERQLDILQNLYCHLFEAQALFIGMTDTGRTEGQMTPEEYAPLVKKAMKSAVDEFVRGRLFIPTALAQQCESFFNIAFEGRRQFSLAHEPMIQPDHRAKSWTSAATIAHREVPKILQQIEEAARAVIHGEQP